MPGNISASFNAYAIDIGERSNYQHYIYDKDWTVAIFICIMTVTALP